MTERSSSHKSDGRQSIRSLGADFSSYEGDNAAFRPPTRSSDILDSCLHRPTGPKVGPAPAMVRCWIGNPCSYEPLLFAVICTGAARSAIEMSLVIQQRFQDRIVRISETESTIELPVYLPDATVQQHSRISGPSKIARLTVDFVIMPVGTSKSRDDKIRIFIGSDVIASHMGDVLFSQSKIFLHVDDGRKVFIPFIRPDAEEAFADIYTAHGSHYTPPTIGSPPSDPVNPVKPPGLDPNPLSQLSVSSPRPIHGPQACVLRGVASMEPHDFVPNAKEHHTVASGTYPPDPTRPWTSTSVAHSDNFDNDSFGPFSPGPPEDISHPSAEAGEAVTRGRSMTNPFEDIPITVQKPKSWGEGARKSSMSYSAPLKESNGGGGGGGGSYSRGSSRGMKVLRTSKSFSSSSEKAPEGQTAKHASFAKAGNSQRGHGRTMSGGDAIAKVGTGGSVLVRTKSSNVVGGATAFHWMATAGGG